MAADVYRAVAHKVRGPAPGIDRRSEVLPPQRAPTARARVVAAAGRRRKPDRRGRGGPHTDDRSGSRERRPRAPPERGPQARGDRGGRRGAARSKGGARPRSRSPTPQRAEDDDGPPVPDEPRTGGRRESRPRARNRSPTDAKLGPAAQIPPHMPDPAPLEQQPDTGAEAARARGSTRGRARAGAAPAGRVAEVAAGLDTEACRRGTSTPAPRTIPAPPRTLVPI